jgi:hypothetical protein
VFETGGDGGRHANEQWDGQRADQPRREPADEATEEASERCNREPE